jgi:histone acetyltransferase (RNA polymerase elongator complex component)
MSDTVLSANERGHTADDVRKASWLIKAYGFELGLQMMVGLYKSTEQDELYTVQEIIKLKPDTVRIYPVVILKGTRLAELYLSGKYKVMSLDRAVELCADMLEKFESNGIRVIRLGLHASENVEKDAVGGLYHPAMRELCESRIFRQKAEKHFHA